MRSRVFPPATSARISRRRTACRSTMGSSIAGSPTRALPVTLLFRTTGARVTGSTSAMTVVAASCRPATACSMACSFTRPPKRGPCAMTLTRTPTLPFRTTLLASAPAGTPLLVMRHAARRPMPIAALPAPRRVSPMMRSTRAAPVAVLASTAASCMADRRLARALSAT